MEAKWSGGRESGLGCIGLKVLSGRSKGSVDQSGTESFEKIQECLKNAERFLTVEGGKEFHCSGCCPMRIPNIP